MTIAIVDFRGDRRDVRYRDRGYEADTNAHIIDWEFIDEKLNEIELTDEDEQSIYDQLYALVRQRSERIYA